MKPLQHAAWGEDAAGYARRSNLVLGPPMFDGRDYWPWRADFELYARMNKFHDCLFLPPAALVPRAGTPSTPVSSLPRARVPAQRRSPLSSDRPVDLPRMSGADPVASLTARFDSMQLRTPQRPASGESSDMTPPPTDAEQPSESAPTERQKDKEPVSSSEPGPSRPQTLRFRTPAATDDTDDYDFDDAQTATSVAHAAADALDAKALYHLKYCLERSTVRRSVNHCSTAAEAWTVLEDIYGRATATSILAITQRLHSLTPEPNATVTEVFNTVMGIADELAAANAPLSDDQLLAKIFLLLPSRFRSTVDLITYTNAFVPRSLAQIRGMLIDKERELAVYRATNPRPRSDAPPRGNASAYAARLTPDQLKRLTPDQLMCLREGLCFQCKKPGHRSDRCRQSPGDKPLNAAAMHAYYEDRTDPEAEFARFTTDDTEDLIVL